MEGKRTLTDITRWGRVPAWWLMHPDMNADRFCVMAAMATYMDGAGFCDPSQATLARRLRRSRPWVNRVVAELASIGLLRKMSRLRQNGGTTSCLYKLALVPGDALPDGADQVVTTVTEPCPQGDTPRHRHDRNQPITEQIQDTRPNARASLDPRPDREAALAVGRTNGAPTVEVPRDWSPPEEAVAVAIRRCPNVDLDEHTSIFVSRCRAKGYRFRPDGLADAWLAWLLEDQRKARERAQERIQERAAGAAARKPHWSPPSSSDHRFDRLDAWSTVVERRALACGTTRRQPQE